MRRILALLGGLLLSVSAVAATGSLSFTRPTAYTDGSPLAASAITAYEFRCAAAGTTAGVSCTPLTLPGTALGGVMTVSVPSTGGTVCVEGRALVGTLASNWAASSGAGCKTFPSLQPSPPGNVVIALNVTISGQAAQVTLVPAFGVLASGARSATVYGFVRAGTPCVGPVVYRYRGKDYRRIARADVGWWNTSPNDNAAAPCAAT